MIPKPMGAPPKYNVERPDHSEFNVTAENMGDGMKMDMANAQHRQKIANTEGAHGQKQDHKHEDAMHTMQMDQMKADQKMQNKMMDKKLDLDMKMAEEGVDQDIAARKQAALTTSMNGLGIAEPPMPQGAPPMGMAAGGWTHNAGVGGYADGLDGNPDVIIDGQFYSEHVPPIQGFGWGDSLVQGIKDFGGSLAPEAAPTPVPVSAADPMAQYQLGAVQGDEALMDASGMEKYDHRTGDYVPTPAAMHAMAPPPSPQAEIDALKVNPRQTNQKIAQDAEAVFNDPMSTPEQMVDASSTIDKVAAATEAREMETTQAAEEQLGATDSQIVQGETDTATDPESAAAIGEEGEDPSTNSTPESLGEADKAPPEEKKGWLSAVGGAFKEAFGDLADPNSLASAAIVFGANKLLGYDDQVASQQALGFYSKGLERKQAAEVAAAKQQADREDKIFESQLGVQAAGQKELQKAAIQQPAAQAKLRRESIEKGRSHGEQVAKAALSNVNVTKIQGKHGTQNKNQITLTDKAAGGQFEKFLTDIAPKGSPLDHNAPGVTQAMDNAIRAAVDHSRATGEDIQDITPYLWAAYIPESTGRGAQDFVGIPAKRMEELTSGFPQMAGKSRGESLQIQMAKGQEAYANLQRSNPKAYKEYEAKKPNGFYNFVRDIQSGKKVM